MKEIVSILQTDIDDGIIYGGAVLAAKDGSVYCDCGAGHTSPERKYATSRSKPTKKAKRPR